MSIDTLLTELEGRTVTPITAAIISGVTPGPAEIKSCTPVTPVTAQTYAIQDEDVFIERAAIIEMDAGIPREWAEAFARMCLMPRPANITRHGWQRIVDNTGRLLDDKDRLRDMVRCGWSIADIFGCHPAAPETRQDFKGLLLLLVENESITSLNEKAIGLQRTKSRSTLYYRKPLNPSADRVMIWELADNG